MAAVLDDPSLRCCLRWNMNDYASRMPTCMMPQRRLLLIAVALACGACTRVGVGPPGPEPSLDACPARRLDVTSWRVVDAAPGVTYRLPTGFVERSRDDLSYREFQIDQTLSGRVAIGFSPSRDYFTTLRRVPSPGMLEMSECVEGPDGRQVLLQAWRTDGGIFRDGERYPLYEVMVLIQVEPTRTLFVTGGGSTPEFQAVLLAIARSVEIDPS